MRDCQPGVREHHITRVEEQVTAGAAGHPGVTSWDEWHGDVQEGAVQAVWFRCGFERPEERQVLNMHTASGRMDEAGCSLREAREVVQDVADEAVVPVGLQGPDEV